MTGCCPAPLVNQEPTNLDLLQLPPPPLLLHLPPPQRHGNKTHSHCILSFTLKGFS